MLDVPVKVITARATKAVKDKFTAEIKAVQGQIDALKKPDLPQASAAQPEHAGGKDSEGSKVKVTKPRAAKTKLSAEDALSGIAAAIQEEERATTASPEAQQSEQAQADAVAVGLLEADMRKGLVELIDGIYRRARI